MISIVGNLILCADNFLSGRGYSYCQYQYSEQGYPRYWHIYNMKC